MNNNTLNLRIKFWGVRGSYATTSPDAAGIGGNTPCVEITAGGHTLILDAGTGIIGLGRSLSARSREMGMPIEATILFSHLHADHVQGFPFFTPAYAASTRLHLIGPAFMDKTVDAVLAQNQMPPLFPVMLDEMASHKEFSHIQGGDTLMLHQNFGEPLYWDALRSPAHAPACGLIVRAHRSYAHPNGGVLCYRIEYGGQAVVYATDTEGYIGTDRRLAAFAEGADVLIHDAQFTEAHYLGQRPGAMCTQGHGHSTAAMACEVAAMAGVKQLLLFHHDPTYDDATIHDIEDSAQALFPNVAAAYEGLEIVVGAADARTEPISLPIQVSA
jgi:ribonuclease BN (tRNA processing enzyme)